MATIEERVALLEVATAPVNPAPPPPPLSEFSRSLGELHEQRRRERVRAQEEATARAAREAEREAERARKRWEANAGAREAAEAELAEVHAELDHLRRQMAALRARRLELQAVIAIGAV